MKIEELEYESIEKLINMKKKKQKGMKLNNLNLKILKEKRIQKSETLQHTSDDMFQQMLRLYQM